jgi:hypothetical protein
VLHSERGGNERSVFPSFEAEGSRKNGVAFRAELQFSNKGAKSE